MILSIKPTQVKGLWIISSNNLPLSRTSFLSLRRGMRRLRLIFKTKHSRSKTKRKRFKNKTTRLNSKSRRSKTKSGRSKNKTTRSSNKLTEYKS